MSTNYLSIFLVLPLVCELAILVIKYAKINAELTVYLHLKIS